MNVEAFIEIRIQNKINKSTLKIIHFKLSSNEKLRFFMKTNYNRPKTSNTLLCPKTLCYKIEKMKYEKLLKLIRKIESNIIQNSSVQNFTLRFM